MRPPTHVAGQMYSSPAIPGWWGAHQDQTCPLPHLCPGLPWAPGPQRLLGGSGDSEAGQDLAQVGVEGSARKEGKQAAENPQGGRRQDHL